MAIIRLIERVAYGSRYKTASAAAACAAACSLTAVFASAATSSAAVRACSVCFFIKNITAGRRISLNRTPSVK